MMRFDGRMPLPQAFYEANKDLALKVVHLIAATGDELPRLAITQITELVAHYPQDFEGNPTFAKAALDLIDKVETSAADKVILLRDLAKMTIVLQRLKANA